MVVAVSVVVVAVVEVVVVTIKFTSMIALAAVLITITPAVIVVATSAVQLVFTMPLIHLSLLLHPHCRMSLPPLSTSASRSVLCIAYLSLAVSQGDETMGRTKIQGIVVAVVVAVVVVVAVIDTDLPLQ